MSGHKPWSEIKHKTRPAPLSTYVLTVHGKEASGSEYVPEAETLRFTDEYLAELVENITDLLPDGYWVEISEWDNDEGDDDA